MTEKLTDNNSLGELMTSLQSVQTDFQTGKKNIVSALGSPFVATDKFDGGRGLENKYSGTFGKGGSFHDSSTLRCGGGGGWFGGACGVEGSGGGSGYTLTKYSYKPVGYIPTSEYYFETAWYENGGASAYINGYCKIELLQALPFLTISSYNSTQAILKANHTDPTLLTKIEYFIDDVLKETITTDLTAEKTINYILEDNALHTLKIVVTDTANATSEKVISISKNIMPLSDSASIRDIVSKMSEIKEGLINGKTSIINVLTLKNIESSLNTSLVDLSEKIKKSFDSSDANVQELQNQITNLNNQLSQRIKWSTGTHTIPAGSQNNFIIPTGLTFVPKTIIVMSFAVHDGSNPSKFVYADVCMTGLNQNLVYDNRIIGSMSVRNVTKESFSLETGISNFDFVDFPFTVKNNKTIRWYALDIEFLSI
ncbi:glycine-rich protein (plasmid) [Clostridioides difficile]|nr:glycine-rich protein [Clostridioides difficile]